MRSIADKVSQLAGHSWGETHQRVTTNLSNHQPLDKFNRSSGVHHIPLVFRPVGRSVKQDCTKSAVCGDSVFAVFGRKRWHTREPPSQPGNSGVCIGNYCCSRGCGRRGVRPEFPENKRQYAVHIPPGLVHFHETGLDEAATGIRNRARDGPSLVLLGYGGDSGWR